jgi:hypothetical protein
MALVFTTGFLIDSGLPGSALPDREITARFPCAGPLIWSFDGHLPNAHDFLGSMQIAIHTGTGRLSARIADRVTSEGALMLSILLAAAITVGGFTYRTETIADRQRPIGVASKEPAVWKEHVEAIVATAPGDRDFSRSMREQATRSRDAFYRGDGGDGHLSFATYENAGWLDVSERVTAASPDLVSVAVEASFYEGGAAHPNTDSSSKLNWSRRLHRLLTQRDVFATPPDRALRRLAQLRFDNRDGLQRPDDPDGIPLSWDHASIGPDGITWSFGPYELGGYLSGGKATVSWSELKPYLRPKLPFVIKTIRAAPE